MYDALDNGLGLALALDSEEEDSSSARTIFGVTFVSAFAALAICALNQKKREPSGRLVEPLL